MINSSSYRIHRMHIRTSHETTVDQPSLPGYQQVLLQLGKRRWVNVVLHSLGWLLLFTAPARFLLAINTNTYFAFFIPLNTVYVVGFIVLISFSYFNYYWLIPFFDTRKKMSGYYLTVFLFTLLLTALQYRAAAATLNPQTTLLVTAYTCILFIVSIFSAIIRHLNNALRMGSNEIVKMKTSLLNTQINPHFLFNSLNWIYLLSLDQSKETPDAILQLSGMMRYILKETSSPFIELATELKYIKDYVALQKGRLGNTVSITYIFPGFAAKGQVAPLLLMSFIENAFKHGVNPNEDSAISIDISISNNRLYLHVINNKTTAAGCNHSNGIGIKNAQQRLQLLYPSMHELEIMENNKIYAVKLSIAIL